MNQIQITIQTEDSGKRIDVFLAQTLEGQTRSSVQQIIDDGHVKIGEKTLKKNYKLAKDDILDIVVPAIKEVDIIPQNIPIDIIYEDDDIIVVNKARGMVVHPAAGNWDGTLVNALMYHCGQSLSGINGEHRPGIVHRIDKDTSGLLVVAKNDIAHRHLAEQIAAHTARRHYQAIVIGSPRLDEGTIEKPIARHKTDRKKMAIIDAGKEAITHFSVLKRYHGYSFMQFELETGRTHQIRVHMASIGHPVIGDPLYGVKKDRFSAINGQCLHAKELTFVHPKTEKQVHFSAPLPHYFTEIIEKLEKMQ